MLRRLAVYLISVSNAIFAGNSIWTAAGPLGGGVFELAFDPSNAQTAYATTRGAVYKTLDAGATWTRAIDGIVATTVYPLPLVLDREAPQILYTFDSSLRLYRSNNGGGSWRILSTNLDQRFLFQTICDVAGETGALLAAFHKLQLAYRSFSRVMRPAKILFVLVLACPQTHPLPHHRRST